MAEAHRRPVARLRRRGGAPVGPASGGLDVSDGLAADAVHLARASGVGLDLDSARGRGRRGQLDEALSGGEDYELVLATPDPDRLRATFAARGSGRRSTSAACTGRAGSWSLDGARSTVGGWRHRF